MPRKKKTDMEPQGTETILQRPMEEILPESMLPYAEYVILERALPRVEDGLKPVQRRILYTMQELGITPDKPHRKSARIVGDCLGKYHPHGDTSVYDAMVRMAQPYNMRSVLVDGHGNFGSVDGDSAAAMRYTEARMAPLALEMLRDLDKDTVDFTLNFDDTLREPVVLPGRFPNLLVNGASGIAVGLATNIPPHNLGEAIDAVIELIDHPKCTVDDLMKFLPGPDFPTGGELIASEEIKRAYETGKGRLIIRAKTSIEKANAGKVNIVITELPYQVNKSALLEKILHLSEEKKGPLSAVSDIRDESDRTGMRAVIELKKDSDAQRVLAYLYKSTDLQTSFNVNMVAIAEGKPVQLSLKQALVHYLNHQKNVVLRRTRYDLDKAKAREHILEGLMIAVQNLDAVIRLIRASKSVKEAKEGLMKKFGLTDVQAQAVLDLRLYRLTGLEIEALRKEYEDIQKLIANLKSILNSERKLLSLIKAELLEVKKKYPQKRMTQISGGENALPEYTEEKVAQDCILATDGILIRRAVEKKDVVPEGWMSLLTRTDRKAILFTNLGNCFVLSPEDVAVPRNRERGSAMAGFLSGWDKEETAVALYDDTVQEDFFFLTKNGFIKRTSASEYGARKGRSSAINLKEGDRVAAVLKPGKEKDILLLTVRGLSIRFSLDEVGATGRATSGVRAITLGRDDAVLTGFAVQSRGEVLVISERGYAKRSLLADHERQSRGGKGQKAFTFVKGGSNGTRLVGAAILQKPCSVAVEQKDGTVTKLHSDEILMLPRASRGSPYVLTLSDNVVTRITVTESE